MPTTLITGASSGIGKELARVFAAHGHDLAITARSEERLNELAAELEKKHGITVTVIPADLSDADTPHYLHEELMKRGIEVDILVNNAGFQVYGPFAENDLDAELAMIQVNLISLTMLTKLFLADMKKRGAGRILNVGSSGSFVPGPWNAVYCAAKAYVLSFSEGIAEELSGTGITVTCLCPGATKTEFAERADMEDSRIFKYTAMKAKPVAKAGYRALMKGKRVEIPGLLNKIEIGSVRFIPRLFVAKISNYLMSRGK